MVPVKNFRFDCVLSRVKAQSQKQLFDLLAEALADASRADARLLSDLLSVRLHKSDDNTGQGVFVVDLKSAAVSKPVSLIATLAEPLDLGAADRKPVDVIAVMLSTKACGTAHLQRLAKVSRLLRMQAFCDSLRACADDDSMRVLFMPDQKWVKAA